MLLHHNGSRKCRLKTAANLPDAAVRQQPVPFSHAQLLADPSTPAYDGVVRPFPCLLACQHQRSPRLNKK